MKKVLFIIQSYPSNRSANVLCDEKIMKAMLETGRYEIHCLAYRFHGQALHEKINGFQVHRCQRSVWWDLYTYARDNETKPFYRFLVKLDRLYMRLRQLFCIPIYPNYEPLLARKMAQEAKLLHTKEAFDLVVAEHHGRDTLYAGGQLKEYDKDVKLVSILWDPLSGRELAKYLPSKYALRMSLKDEARLLRNSDRIISLRSNQGYQEQNSSHKPFFDNVRFLDIPGIIRPAGEYVAETYTKRGMINILYSGLLSPDREPSVLIEIINRSKYATLVHLMFFSIGNETIAKVSRQLKDFRGQSLIHPYVSKSLITSIAAHSEILVNLGGPNPRMVPSKIFEYMSLGKPILSTYYTDEEASKWYLDKYPLAICLDVRKSIEQNVAEFERFVELNLHKIVAFEDVERQFPLNNPNAFIEVFEQVL